jgi:hypothetical protein
MGAVWLTIHPLQTIVAADPSDNAIANLCTGSLAPQQNITHTQLLLAYMYQHGLHTEGQVCNGTIPIVTYKAFPAELYVLSILILFVSINHHLLPISTRK